MAGYQTLQVRLCRDSFNTPFGFRLQGGADLRQPLTIQRVFTGSPAEGHLQRGDIIVGIDSFDATQLSHRQAQEIIKGAGGQLLLGVKRGGNLQENNFQAPYRASASDLGQSPYANYAPAPPPAQQDHQHHRAHPPSHGPGHHHQHAQPQQHQHTQPQYYQPPQPQPQPHAHAHAQPQLQPQNQHLPPQRPNAYTTVTIQNANAAHRRRSVSPTMAARGAYNDSMTNSFYNSGPMYTRSQSQHGQGMINRVQKSLDNLTARNQYEEEHVDYSFMQLPVRDRMKAFNKLDQKVMSLPRTTSVTRQYNFTNRAAPSYMKPFGGNEPNFAWAPSTEKLKWARSNPQMAVNSSPAFSTTYTVSAQSNVDNRQANVYRERPQQTSDDFSGGPPAWKGTLRSSKVSEVGTTEVVRRRKPPQDGHGAEHQHQHQPQPQTQHQHQAQHQHAHAHPPPPQQQQPQKGKSDIRNSLVYQLAMEEDERKHPHHQHQHHRQPPVGHGHGQFANAGPAVNDGGMSEF